MLIDEEESADEHWDPDIYQIHEQLDDIKSYNENTVSTDLERLRDEESMTHNGLMNTNMKYWRKQLLF